MPDLDFLRKIKKIAIVALFSDDELMERLVLKGGNLLDVVYDISGRASVDVDLSMDGEFDDLEDVQRKVSYALETTFLEHGYVVFDFSLRIVPPVVTDDLKDFWGGYKIEFKLIDKERYERLRGDIAELRRNATNVGRRESTKFKIEISRHEFCEEKEMFRIDDYSIYGYSPPMFVAEKLRAICQQMPEYVVLVHSNPSPRARDFLDINIVSSYLGVKWDKAEFKETIRKVFDKKRVPLQLITKIEDVYEYHADDFQAVQATVLPGYDLQEFQFYFDYVCARCKALKTFWNV